MRMSAMPRPNRTPVSIHKRLRQPLPAPRISRRRGKKQHNKLAKMFPREVLSRVLRKALQEVPPLERLPEMQEQVLPSAPLPGQWPAGAHKRKVRKRPRSKLLSRLPNRNSRLKARQLLSTMRNSTLSNGPSQPAWTLTGIRFSSHELHVLLTSLNDLNDRS